MSEFKDVPFEMKAEDIEPSGIFKGYASMFGGEPDDYGDVVQEGAFIETLAKGGRNGFGIAMLWQHDPTKPVGVWSRIEENKKGLKVHGQLAINTTLGKDAYELMKMGAVQGLSIGYKIAKDGMEYDDRRKIRKLKKIDLWEISPVTFPASTRARITGVKNIEEARNERELEVALRESGVSRSAALYIVSMCRPLFADKSRSNAEKILEALRESRSRYELVQICHALRTARKIANVAINEGGIQ